MNKNPTTILRLMFILGASVDGAIAVSWFLIASGLQVPNILNGYMGTGPDYQLAMYVAAMFMAGWTILLARRAYCPAGFTAQVAEKRLPVYVLDDGCSELCSFRVAFYRAGC
jgi:hypothetical protein